MSTLLWWETKGTKCGDTNFCITYSFIFQINGALLKVLRMKLTPTLKSILDSTCTTENQLPSRAMLEWLLIKLQGFARLLVRLVITSHRVGFMFRQCLAIGHNWHIIVVLMSLASQIWWVETCKEWVSFNNNSFQWTTQSVSHTYPYPETYNSWKEDKNSYSEFLQDKLSAPAKADIQIVPTDSSDNARFSSKSETMEL
jgi:hypothetical protein